MTTPTHLDLFSGVGGFSLGFERAGFKTVAFSEIEPFPCRVLAERPSPLSVPLVSGGYGHSDHTDHSSTTGSGVITVTSVTAPAEELDTDDEEWEMF